MRSCIRVAAWAASVAMLLLCSPAAQAGWVSVDIGTAGNPALPGSATGSPPDPVTIVGGGSDIWDNADHFHFAYNDNPVGDFSAIVRMISQVETNEWAKAGIMARAALTAGSVHVHTSGTPGQGITQQWRDTTDGGSGWQNTRLPGSPNSRDGGALPYWMRLDRVGNTFTSYWATDSGGTPGAWQGAQVHVSPMPATAYLGLSVTSHNNGAVSTVVFDSMAGFQLYDATRNSAGTDYWDVATTWTPAGTPGANDYLIVDDSDVVTSRLAVDVGGRLDITGSGAVVVQSGAVLTIGQNVAVTSTAGTALNVGGTLQTGSLSLSGSTTLNVGAAGTLRVANNIDVGSSSPMTLGSGATLDVGAGTIAAVATGGSSNVTVNSGLLGVGVWNDGGTPGTLTKRGAGTLGSDNSGGFNNLAATALAIQQGEVFLRGANPLAGANQVTLSGGKLTLQPGVTAAGTGNELRERYFSGDAAALINPLGPGQGYLAGTPAYDDLYSAGSTRMTGLGRHTYLDLDQGDPGAATPIPDDFYDRTGGLADPPVRNQDPNNFGAVWSGTLMVAAPGMGVGDQLEAGQITLGTASDDGSTWWVDGQLVVNNNAYQGRTERTATVMLGAGAHEIFIGWYEGGGGANMEAKFGQGAGLGYNAAAMHFVDPTNPAQAGMWTSQATVNPYDVGGLTVKVDAPGSSLNLLSRDAVTLGTLNLHNTGEVTLEGAAGGINVTNTNVVTAGPTHARINAAVPVDPGLLDMASSPGSPVTLHIGGPNTLTLTQTAQNAGDGTFQVEAGGTLKTTTIAPLGGAELVLNGGTYHVMGTPTLMTDALRGSIFLGTPGNDTPLNLENANYQVSATRAFTGDKANTILVRSEDPNNNVIVTGTTNNWDSFPNFDGNADNFVTAFSGRFTPNETGTYNFHWNNDDRGSMFIDLNNNNTFDPGERISDYEWNRNGNVYLDAGTAYNVIYMAQEFGGGQSVWWAYTPPSGGERQVNPAAQPGLWSTMGTSAIDATALDIAVTAPGSGLRATSDGRADFGHLALDNGTSLTTSGAAMTFASVAINGPAGRSATLATNNNVSFGTYNDGGSAATFVKGGPGTLTLDNSGPGIQAAATTWKVNQGTLMADARLSDASALGGSTHLTLSGGTASFGDQIAPPGAPPGGALGAWNFNSNDATDSSGNNYHGTPNGPVAYSSDTGFGTGRSLDLTGGNGYVTVSTGGTEDVFDGGGAMTIAAWVKGWPGGWDPFVCKHGEPNGWQMRRHGGDPTVDWTTRGVGANNGDFPSVSGAVSDAQWHQITMTYDGSAKRIYIDGVLNATEVAGGTITGSNEMLTFGARNTGPGSFGNFFNGKLDEVYFYNRALDATEVAALQAVRTAPDMSNVDVLVTANSTLQSRSLSPMAFHDLTLNDTTILATTGSPMSFNSTALAGPSGGINNGNQVDIGSYTDGGADKTFLKRGAGTMIVDTTKGISAARTNFRVEGGLLQPSITDPLGAGGSTVTLAGGQLRLQGAATPGGVAPVSGQVAHWSFDNSSDPGHDDTAGVHNGAVTSATWVAGGVLNGALSFAGNGYVEVPYAAPLGLNEYTVSAWVNLAGEPGMYGILGTRFNGDETFDVKVQGANIHGDVGSGTAGWINTNVDIGPGNTGSNGQGGDLALAQWYMVTYVIDDTNKQFDLYIDGDLKRTIGYSGTPMFMKAGQSLRIGNSSGGELMNGLMDEVFLYGRALNATEIHDLYNARTLLGAINEPDIHIGVDGPGGTLALNTDFDAALGNLTFKSGTLNITGAPMGVTFTGGGVDAAASAVTLNNPMDVTITGPYDGHGAVTTFTKTGAGALRFDQGTSNHGGVSVQVKGGLLSAGAPMQAANLSIAPGANADTGPHNVTISDGGQYSAGPLNIKGAGSSFGVGGTNLGTSPDRLALAGGTVAVRNGGMPGGMQLWLNAGTLGPGAVTNWQDQSGLGHNADYSAGTPTYVAGALNGQPVVQFDGNSRIGTSYNFDPSTQYSILTVARYTGGDSERVISSRDRNWLFGFHGNGIERWHAEGWIYNGQGAADDTNWQLHAGTINNAADPQASFWRNGNLLVADNTGSGNGNQTIGRLLLGAWGDGGGESSRCEVAEVLVFDGVLSGAELNNVGGYLAAKYGLGTSYTGSIQPEPINLPSTDVMVTASATLYSDTDSTAAYGKLYLQGGPWLTLAGAPGGVSFAGLSGNGSVLGSLTVNGQVSPGDSIGAISITGNLALGDGSVYVWEQLGPTDHDLVTISGLLTLEGMMELMIVDTGVPPVGGMEYLLFDAGQVAGFDPRNWTINDPTGLWAGWNVRLDAGNGDIFLSQRSSDIPEPLTLGLVAMGLAGLGGYIRRRRTA